MEAHFSCLGDTEHKPYTSALKAAAATETPASSEAWTEAKTAAPVPLLTPRGRLQVGSIREGPFFLVAVAQTEAKWEGKGGCLQMLLPELRVAGY